MEKVNVDALFLGPKSENHAFFKELLSFMMDEHIHWRRNFHPNDPEAVTLSDMDKTSFRRTRERTREVLLRLSDQLKAKSLPWHSPRYLGHMNSDILMPATLAHMAAILYNPNNVAFEASPATTHLEIEAGREMAAMLGYDPAKSWCHITSGGHLANFEGVWFMRNAKSFPLGVKAADPEAVAGKTDWELLNLSPGQIFDLVAGTRRAGTFDAAREQSVRYTGVQGGRLGRLLVPQSKHYSWDKAADVLGIGVDNMIKIQVGSDFRMDMDALRAVVEDLTSREIPILGVVCVVGSTEEGAVDKVHEAAAMRREFESRGVSFWIHVDAAYGGYTRSIFLDEDGAFMPLDKMKRVLHEDDVVAGDVDWPKPEVHAAYEAMAEADSITVDPHKMGYTPYSAGMIAAKDSRVTDLVSYFAPYTFTKGEAAANPDMLGAYIMEGSKAGAAAAAVWAAHQVAPLNVKGHGRVQGRSMEAANHFYASLTAQEPIKAENGRCYEIVTLTSPDFNLVNFVFNPEGNTNLDVLNRLTLGVYNRCSYVDGPVYYDSFLTSHTEFTVKDYGDAPIAFLERMGFSADDYRDNPDGVWVLRACILTPFLRHNTTYDKYYRRFIQTMKTILTEVDEA